MLQVEQKLLCVGQKVAVLGKPVTSCEKPVLFTKISPSSLKPVTFAQTWHMAIFFEAILQKKLSGSLHNFSAKKIFFAIPKNTFHRSLPATQQTT